jgi:hypothetical protein
MGYAEIGATFARYFNGECKNALKNQILQEVENVGVKLFFNRGV